jgi:CS domain
MSRLADYSKFDHLNDDSDDEDNKESNGQLNAVAAATDSTTAKVVKGGRHQRNPRVPNRFIFEYDDTPVYEWEQALSEVVLYIPGPPAKGSITCQITASRLKLGQKGASKLFLDEPTFAAVDTTDSTWCWEDNEDGEKVIVIYMQKAAKGVVWECPLAGPYSASLDAVSLNQVREQLMKERWQQENPGMDFRDATFNGSVPDPRTYMGGVSYD